MLHSGKVTSAHHHYIKHMLHDIQSHLVEQLLDLRHSANRRDAKELHLWVIFIRRHDAASCRQQLNRSKFCSRGDRVNR